MKYRIVAVFIFSVLFGWNAINAQVENIQTFAKLYGYVRWFYPGDEASQIDWDKFAVYGIQKIEKAQNEQELKQILLELFKPVAPAIEIIETSKKIVFDKKSITPNDTLGLKPTSWLHYGVGLGFHNDLYKSIRINRDTIENVLGSVYLFPLLSKHKGKEFKLTTFIKSSKPTNYNAYIQFVSKVNEAAIDKELCISFTNTINANCQWKKFEKTIRPDSTHDCLVLSFGSSSDVQMLFDSISLEVKEKNIWKPIDISCNLDYWSLNNYLFHISLDSLKTNKKNIRIKIDPSEIIPKIGSSINKNIGSNLSCIMPLTLYSDRSHTYPIIDTIKLNQLKIQLNSISDTVLTAQTNAVKIANVIIAWNVLQHFYPYFDVTNVDWDKVLSQTIDNVNAGICEVDYYKTLCKMVAQLKDGHGKVDAEHIHQWGLPFAVDLIENKIVIIGSRWRDFLEGDIITSIGDKTAMEELLYQESFISGSMQLKRYRGLNMFSADFSKSETIVKLIRNGEEKEVKCKRYSEFIINYNENRKTPSSENFIECKNGILYLHRNPYDFSSILPNLKDATGLIVGQGFNLWNLMGHVIKEPVLSAPLNFPVATYPDRENIYFDSKQLKIYPEEPFIKAKLVFLNYPSNISAGETMMGIVDNYKLGTTVGDTTAGTNGDINRIQLMGGYSITWTGTKVLKHDGSQLHLSGFRPDFPVSRTIQAIKENRDEYLEKAINILKD